MRKLSVVLLTLYKYRRPITFIVGLTMVIFGQEDLGKYIMTESGYA